MSLITYRAIWIHKSHFTDFLSGKAEMCTLISLYPFLGIRTAGTHNLLAVFVSELSFPSTGGKDNL